ncbi:MAG TPA: riboflavin synthase [Mycobacteriales bacterium]|nr:riboflavin synthase [Mycobacteriales bacterium]
MFTGIVEEVGEVVRVDPLPDAARLVVRGTAVTSDARDGESVAVNGVCLTVVETADGCFSADVMAETLRRSSLGGLRAGSRVNLERAVRVGDRLGGHVVQGHVDGTGELLERVRDEHWDVVRISLPDSLARYVVQKGSITVDGVSLTVVDVAPGSFSVSLIPTTLASTTLGGRSPGETVNLEVDVLAKYVERLLQHAPTAPAAATTEDPERT